ncbi:MAG: hypothetical protein U1E63_02090 [Burkholderiales bacterium]
MPLPPWPKLTFATRCFGGQSRETIEKGRRSRDTGTATSSLIFFGAISRSSGTTVLPLATAGAVRLVSVPTRPHCGITSSTATVECADFLRRSVHFDQEGRLCAVQDQLDDAHLEAQAIRRRGDALGVRSCPMTATIAAAQLGTSR